MTLRISYIVGLIACTAVGLSSVPLVESVQAQTLNITGPNGEIKQQAKRQYGPTTSRDTFWSIAQQVRPNDRVSVYQVMAALFDANPHAFSGNNYNTLERGMILLVPSADEIAAIPNDVAKRRAAQNDRRATTPTQPRPVIKPAVVSANIATLKNPTADKLQQIVQQNPAVEVQTKAINEANTVVVNNLNSTLDKANAKALMLTDELARAQDELMVSNNDNQVLENKVEQMSLNIASLEEDLQLLREQNESLTLENNKLVDQTPNIEPVVDQPTDFWRSVMDNTILLILAASIPILIIFAVIFWLLSRRNRNPQQSEIKTENHSVNNSGSASANDDTDDLVIHLDSDDEESIDDVLDLDSVNLQPDMQMSSDAEMDRASEMFISEKDSDDDEGTSLDDLWAEAMEEQDSELEPLDDDDDLDSLLAGLDDEPSAALNSVAPENDLDSLLAGLDTDVSTKENNNDLAVSVENNIDSLLTDLDTPPESDVAAEPIKADSSKSMANDDIDSLLADLDTPPESDIAADPIKADSSKSMANDDIDSLLADLDTPPESDVAAEPIKADSSKSMANDDIDSLLADLDMPPESDVAAEPIKADSSKSMANDDIDSLLADLDMPPESDVAAEPIKADSSKSMENDDIDSLLADVDTPPESDVAAEPIKADSSKSMANDDIDSLLADLDTPPESDVAAEPIKVDSSKSMANDDIDSLLADLDTPPEPDAVSAQVKADSPAESDVADEPLTADSVNSDDDIAALIAAQYQNDEQKVEPSNGDIDALSVSLNEPVIDTMLKDMGNGTPREAKIAENDDFAAQIAAELNDENNVDSIDDNETSDEDIDALLASLNEPVVETQIIDQDNATLQAQIAAELDNEPDNEALILDDAALDDDINALLASFKPDVNDDFTPSAETDRTQSVSDTIDDSELFEEFDQYLGDTDLTQKDDGDDTGKDAGSEVETAETSRISNNAGTELGSSTTSAPEVQADDGLDVLLAQIGHSKPSSSAQNKINKESGFFNDLKANKPKAELLDWESDLLNAVESAADEKEIPEVSDDDLLAAFSQSLKDDDNDDGYTSEDDYILSNDNLTVDEALAALDQTEHNQTEHNQAAEYKVSDDDLMRFERENGYIDIDKLLNDADEDDDRSDQYKDVNIDMGSVNSLLGNADMIDVDDEENSVNAKLDLARAYIEIEDQDSARALLKEVKMDGNERQKLEAANLLKNLN